MNCVFILQLLTVSCYKLLFIVLTLNYVLCILSFEAEMAELLTFLLMVQQKSGLF